MAGRIFLIFGCLAALSFYNGLASEPSPLQDFCVADANSGVFVNGRACKDASKVQAEDFFFQGLHLEGDTSNSLGSAPTLVSVANLAGLNTLGVSLLRLDFAPLGLVPPHLHPRASEVLTVVEGTIEVGFVTSNPGNRLITKVLNKGDVFVFPVGLIHYQRNVGKGKAISLSGLSSQNPGVVLVANTVFGSTPDIPADILAKAFQLDSNTILNLQSKFQPGK